MKKINCWEIDVKKVSFESILKWCQEHHQVDRLLLGIEIRPGRKNRQKRGVSSPAQLANAYRYFGPHVLSVHSVRGWPGSEFVAGTAPILEIDLNDQVINTCLEIGPSLSDWTRWNDNIPLPEDPCLFKSGAKYPTLVTVAHEQEAWLITDKRVDLAGVKLDSIVTAEDLFFKGRCFCKNPRPCRSPFMRIFENRSRAL